MELVTIETSLADFIKHDRTLLDTIRGDIIEITQLTNEASAYINYCCMKKYASQDEDVTRVLFKLKPSFLEYFYHIIDTDQKTRYARHPGYKATINHDDMKLYNVENRQNLVQSAANLYTTYLEDSICNNMYNRVLKYFKTFYKGSDDDGTKPCFKRTMTELFNSQASKPSNPDQMAFWQQEFPAIKNFYTLRSDWYKFISFLVEMRQKFIEAGCVDAPFEIFPVLHARRLPIYYNTFAARQLLVSAELIPAEISRSMFCANRESHWKEFFNYTEYESESLKFGFAFSTEGTSALLHVYKLDPETQSFPYDPAHYDNAEPICASW